MYLSREYKNGKANMIKYKQLGNLDSTYGNSFYDPSNVSLRVKLFQNKRLKN